MPTPGGLARGNSVQEVVSLRLQEIPLSLHSKVQILKEYLTQYFATDVPQNTIDPTSRLVSKCQPQLFSCFFFLLLNQSVSQLPASLHAKLRFLLFLKQFPFSKSCKKSGIRPPNLKKKKKKSHLQSELSYGWTWQKLYANRSTFILWMPRAHR